jgi:hypothetical protein
MYAARAASGEVAPHSRHARIFGGGGCEISKQKQTTRTGCASEGAPSEEHIAEGSCARLSGASTLGLKGNRLALASTLGCKRGSRRGYFCLFACEL